MSSSDFRGLMPEQMTIHELSVFCKTYEDIHPPVIKSFCIKHLASIWQEGDGVFLLSRPFNIRKTKIIIPHQKHTELTFQTDDFVIDTKRTVIRIKRFQQAWITEKRRLLGFFDLPEMHKSKLGNNQQIRLNDLEKFIKLLEAASASKMVIIDAQDLPLTKRMIFSELKKRYANFRKIEYDQFEKDWKAATKAGICANQRANVKNGENFLKSIFD